MLNEISLTEKDKCMISLYDFTCIQNIKNKWTETELKTQKTAGWQRGKERNKWDRWRGTDFQFQNKRHKYEIYRGKYSQ